MKALRWLGGGLLALLGLVLALLLTWAATQGPDAAPRPLPAALELAPRAAAPTAVSEHLERLHAPGDDGVSQALDRAPLACHRGEDCAKRWARDIPAVAAQLQAHARLGARCDAALAARAEDGAYVEWLPEQLGPAAALPGLHGLMSCQRWLIGQALVAAAAGDAAAAQARLQQSYGWAQDALQGARSLITHQVAHHQAHDHLQAVAAAALLQPGWVAMLQPLAPPWPDELLDPVRWMPVEAAFGRGAIDAADAHCQAGSPTAPGALPPDALARIGQLLCRHRIGWHPETTRQQLDALWLARIERLRDGAGPWLAAVRERSAEGGGADATLPWAWRNTIGALLVGAAQDDALYAPYIASPADLALHQQMLAVTLALRRADVPAAGREAWLAASGLLPPEVLARVRWAPDGRALQWRTWDEDLRGDAAGAAARAPARIPLDAAG